MKAQVKPTNTTTKPAKKVPAKRMKKVPTETHKPRKDGK